MPVPFAPLTDASLQGLIAHLRQPWEVGILLVRRGGFAVAHLTGTETRDSKVGKRHVQGRSKAGGWSQQRFARRRDNQAKAAFDAAAEHADRLLSPVVSRLDLVATGGDRKAVEAVLARRELAPLSERPQHWLGGVADPRRDVLLRAIVQVRSLDVAITDPAA